MNSTSRPTKPAKSLDFKESIVNLFKNRCRAGIYSLLVATMAISAQSCRSNKASQWEKSFSNQLAGATKDGIVTENEYKFLQHFLDSAPKNVTSIYGHPLNHENPDVLADILIERGITGDAVALKNRMAYNAPFSRLRIMLENSASMIGYTSAGNPSFTSPVISLFNVIDKDTEIITGYVHDKGNDNCEFQIVDAYDFQKDLANGKIQTATSSPLDQILEMVAETTNDSTVTALVTDGIVSGTNGQILSTLPNRDWTIKNLPLIGQKVRDAAKVLHDKGEQFVLYRFETDFRGDYYNYRNLRQRFSNNVTRPFFIILTGTEKNLENVRQKLAKEAGFKATNSLCSYELEAIPVIKSGIISYVPVAGVQKPKIDITPAKASIKFKKPIAIPFSFRCRVILDKEVPDRCKDAEFISQNIRLSYTDLLSGAVVDKTDMIYDVQPAADSPGAFDIFIQATPDFINTISKLRTMRLYMPLTADTWYRELSVSDDEAPGWDISKTFHLDVLAEGLIKGFELDNDDKSLVDININLQK